MFSSVSITHNSFHIIYIFLVIEVIFVMRVSSFEQSKEDLILLLNKLSIMKLSKQS